MYISYDITVATNDFSEWFKYLKIRTIVSIEWDSKEDIFLTGKFEK